MDPVIHYYQAYDEDSRLDRDKVHQTEFFTTVRILDSLIEAGSNILDVGAGTGKYSFYYAVKGYCVTATDVVPKHVEIMKAKLERSPNISNMEVSTADARDLSKFDGESFDVVLCMGPLYHLGTTEEREKSIKECLRVLREGGILAVSYINKYAVYLNEVGRNKESLYTTELNNIIDFGFELMDERNRFYFVSPQEIEGFMRNFEIEQIDHVATDGIGYIIKDLVNGFNEHEYGFWLNHHFETCREWSLMGYSLHGLYVCRKK